MAATTIKENWYAMVMTISLAIQYRGVKVISVLSLNKSRIGPETYTEKLPVIPKTMNIITKCQADLAPKFLISFPSKFPLSSACYYLQKNTASLVQLTKF